MVTTLAEKSLLRQLPTRVPDTVRDKIVTNKLPKKKYVTITDEIQLETGKLV